MSKQYCFKIINPEKLDFDPEALKLYIKTLYIGKGKTKFNKKDKPFPFVVIFVKRENNTCIVLNTKGKAKIDRIEKINKGLKSSHLQWEGLTLGKPAEFIEGTQTWFNDTNTKKKGQKWVSIVQVGPYFPHITKPYTPLGGKLMYEGRMYKLNPQEEQLAMLYAKRIVSEKDGDVVDRLTTDGVFNRNFWNDFKKHLSSKNKAVFKSFNKLSWKNLVSLERQQKANKPTDADKLKKKVENIEIKREYMYAYLDGNKEQVGNFTVEPVGFFMGRGKNPLRGRIKKEVNPEDVTINVGKDDPVPTPPTGHTWGKVVHDHKAVWLSKWKDSITGNTKYVQFSANGKFKGQSDLSKYEKARKLQRHIELVKTGYMLDAKSTNDEKMQLGTVLWLIDNHGIRPGDERSDDQADTVGASTLRVEHVKLLINNNVKFEFLGKDSIKFKKEFKVPHVIYTNLKRLTTGRTSKVQVFNLISASSINNYLKQFDADFSAKVFRTRLGSSIMFNALLKVKIPKNSTKKTIKRLFNEANTKVAEVLNHTRSITAKAKESLKKLKKDLKDLKAKLKATKEAGKSTVSLKKRVVAKKESIDGKSNVMAVAINTSLTNYIDPRIVVSWAEKQGKGRGTKLTNQLIEAVYSSTMRKKFEWAIKSTPKDWNWLISPLDGNSELPQVKLQLEKDYKIILDACKSNFQDIGKLMDLTNVLTSAGVYVYPALDWLYPFTMYAVEENKGNVLISDKFNKFYSRNNPQ